MKPADIPRNSPCPCGSGKKYKNCCIGKRLAASTTAGSSRTMLVGIGVVAALILGAWAWNTRTSESPGDFISAPVSPPATAPFTGTMGGTPAPYEYDAVNDRHWHAGHGHWHNGPPPPPEARSLPTPAAQRPVQPVATPEPYEYDAVNDRHWHAGHGHWHSGPPPPPEDRTP